MDRRTFLQAAASVAAAVSLPPPPVEELVPVKMFVIDSVDPPQGEVIRMMPKSQHEQMLKLFDHGFISQKTAMMARAVEIQAISGVSLLEAMGYAEYDLFVKQKMIAGFGIPPHLLDPSLGDNDATQTIPEKSWSDDGLSRLAGSGDGRFLTTLG